MEKKQKKKDWQEHLEKAALHPQGVKGYCREHDLGNSTFHYWKKKLTAPKSLPKAFAAVEIMRSLGHSPMLPDPNWLADFLRAYAKGSK